MAEIFRAGGPFHLFVTTPYRNERRQLPLLDQIRVASPCPAKWEEMVGNDRKRFCLSCDKHVFNLSALSREDAEQFLAENAGGEVCVRYYQRADGTIMTSDCSVGVRRKNRKKLALAVAGAGAMAFGAVAALMHHRKEQEVGKIAMGAIAMPDPRPTDPADLLGPPPPAANFDESPRPLRQMGGVHVPHVPPPPPIATNEPAPAPTTKHVVGRMPIRRR